MRCHEVIDIHRYPSTLPPGFAYIAWHMQDWLKSVCQVPVVGRDDYISGRMIHLDPRGKCLRVSFFVCRAVRGFGARRLFPQGGVEAKLYASNRSIELLVPTSPPWPKITRQTMYLHKFLMTRPLVIVRTTRIQVGFVVSSVLLQILAVPRRCPKITEVSSVQIISFQRSNGPSACSRQIWSLRAFILSVRPSFQLGFTQKHYFA